MGKPLLTVIRDLALDPAEQAAFQAAPQDYLGRHGYDGVTADELREAVSLAADTMEPQVAQAITPPEGDEANIVETLQRVTHGTGSAFTDTAVTETVPGPETATDVSDADIGGPDLAFGAGSAGEVDFDSDFGEGDPDGESDMVDTLSFGESPLAGDADEAGEDLDFGSAASGAVGPEAMASDSELDLDDDSFQAADDFADELPDSALAPMDDGPLDDIGAF